MKRVQVNKTSKLFFLNVLLLSCASASASDVDSSFYGSLRLGADYVDSGTADDAANGRDFLSRIGVNAEVQLSDGLTGVGKVEYGLRGDDGVNFNQNQKPGLRQIYVGLKGNFGTVTYGSQTIIWHQYVRSAYFSDGLDSLRQGAIRDDDMLQWQKTYNSSNRKARWRFNRSIPSSSAI